MIKKILNMIKNKSNIVNLYNKFNSNVINIILKICNEKNPENLKEIINKYLIINNEEIEKDYKRLIEMINKSNNIQEKRIKEIVEIIYEASLILQMIHKKMIAYQIMPSEKLITVFVKIKNFFDGLNVIINNSIEFDSEIKIENREIINEILEAKNQYIETIKNYSVDKYMRITEINNELEKIIKLIEKIKC